MSKMDNEKLSAAEKKAEDLHRKSAQAAKTIKEKESEDRFTYHEGDFVLLNEKDRPAS